jgi:biotin transport system substrate-specific component
MSVRLPRTLLIVVGLSWCYAFCSQVTLWLPCMPVPVSLQPLPLYVATLIFGWPAVTAFVLYLLQGACGAPIFAGMQGGLMRLLGPTGGYLLGFLCAMVFIVFVREQIKQHWFLLLMTVFIANMLAFACGLWRLSSFVAATDLLAVGLAPFLVGDFVLKPLLLMSFMTVYMPRNGKKNLK